MSMNFARASGAIERFLRASRGIAYGLGISFALPSCIALYVLPVASAQAQSCWIQGSLGLDFGTVTPAGRDATASGLSYTCQGSSQQAVHYRVCLFLGPGQWNTIAPRRMTNHNGSFMHYDLYSDPARTQIIGPASSGYPVYSWTFTVPAGTNSISEDIRVYGRVPAGQSLPATWRFQEQQVNGSFRWRSSSGGFPPESSDCQTGGNTGGQVHLNSSGVYAHFANACLVVAATDLEFGNVSVLDSARDQISTIQLQCPTGTVWRVGLNDGSHASGGVRRMAGPGGGHIRYELYRDGARNQRWGNTIDTDTSNGVGTGGTQSLTVHGRVPAQETPAAGTYSDTITVTLTF